MFLQELQGALHVPREDPTTAFEYTFFNCRFFVQIEIKCFFEYC